VEQRVAVKLDLATGITTGTCTAAAAQAAVRLLFKSETVRVVTVHLPDSGELTVPVEYVRLTKTGAVASVKKYSGNDPDATDGVSVIVEVCSAPDGCTVFCAGDGVGVVTKPGLSVPAGEPAINPVPRKMILEAIREITDQALKITISIPGGAEIAARTFNPKLGIEGGLSILGTTGIVRPFSLKAVQETIRCALNVAYAAKVKEPVLVPGNIGRRAARYILGPLEQGRIIEASNEWGFTIDLLSQYSWRDIIVLGHPGKLCKLANGQWDTHSSRSSSANAIIEKVLRDMSITIPEQKTTEGYFQAMPDDKKKEVAMILSRQVADAIHKRNGSINVSVILVAMNERELGRYEPF
jgi:cobalt-precorrin-5B (C1)-methyltransferase